MTTGVIIGRFQVPDLTEGHRELIRRVSQDTDQLVFLVGQQGMYSNARYPLNFGAVKVMLAELYPSAICDVIYDHESDEKWSQRVDDKIHNLAGIYDLDPHHITLYGGRDSFVPHYFGKFPTEIFLFPELETVSGSVVREAVQFPKTKEGREGAIWASRPWKER